MAKWSVVLGTKGTSDGVKSCLGSDKGPIAG